MKLIFTRTASGLVTRTRRKTGCAEEDAAVQTPPPVSSPCGQETMTSTDEHLAEDVASMNVGAATLPLDAVNVKDGTKLPKPDEGWAWSITDDSASGSQSLLLVKKPPVAQAGSEWHHFDGVECAPSDFYIDLEGSRTDQYVYEYTGATKLTTQCAGRPSIPCLHRSTKDNRAVS